MKKGLIAAISLFFALNVQAASVWKVSNNSHSLYIGGTIHILSPQDYPLPPSYKFAYKESDKLIFETDIAALTTPEFSQLSMQKLTYQDGRTLQSTLQPETFAALKSHLESRGVPIANMQKLKPSLVGVTISMLELQRLGLTSQGVDSYYYTIAMGDGKLMDWFETPEEQLDFIANMGEGDDDAFVRYSIEDVKKIPSMLEQLRGDWRAGDVEALNKYHLLEFKESYPDIYHTLLTERNAEWMPDIEEMLTTPEVEFVLVGTLHLPGETGLLKLLEAKGYTVTQVAEPQ
ncbi:TraB/GumN family protein [Alteromonas sp. ASW11-130]|uniref:TraB/GumN family protein n=1 Tax=Alteromonas sp. ASW11-130 TaxID=3015775 RepID=UPI002241FE4D|nr:TraB/GumN family protein [Alteromonas sp. ASW11-130]MCW8092536.1 TraB/GumN family protein [Alteromonas sp. ASW11-130]